MRIPVLRSAALLALVAGLALFIWTPTVWAHEHSGVEVEAAYTSLDRTVLHVHINEYFRDSVNIDGTEYTRINLEGEGLIQQERPGFPTLPAIYRSLMIPDTAQMQVNVLNQEYHEIRNVDIVPDKGLILRNVDPATVPYVFNEVYETDTFYPGNVSLNRDPYIMRNVRGMVVEIFPFQYNPVQRTLRVYHELEIEVVAVGESGTNVLNRTSGPHKPSLSFYEMQQRHFMNSNITRTEPPTEEGDMLIICHGAFMSNMQPLVDWKNATGINTTIVDVATVGNNSSAILSYVTNLYNQGNLAFVLLVGDSNEVKSGSYGSGLSDAYYSTITADWYPDLFVGRFSATTTAQVDTQVERTVAYETEGHNISMGGWNAMALGVASNQGSGVGHYGEADNTHIDLIRDELLAYGFTSIDRIYDPSGTASQVATALNAGRRLANYCGHGSSTSWGSTGFSNSNVNSLTNVGKLPFIHSVACVNGAFGSGTCFAEAWLRATSGSDPTGAIGCYMSTVNQSWVPPMYAQGNHSKNGKYGSAERFWMETHDTLGGIWYGGSCCMMDIAGSSGRSEFMNWVIFGDPSLRLREATPPLMSMSFPNGVPSGLYPPGPEMPVTVEIKPGTENYVPGSGYLHYRFDGGAFIDVAVTPLGGDMYEAVIPNTSPGDEPEFYFTADTDGGTTIYQPTNAPSSTFGYEVAFIELLMEDDFETNTGWTVQNTSVTTGEFERADPIGTDAQPENDHSPAGVNCYVTGRLGGSIGDDDLDGGPTRLISPTIDLSSGDAEMSFYYYFYHSTNGGAIPLSVEISNNNGTSWTSVASINDTPSWTLMNFTVSDFVAPTANIKLRISASDNPNDSVVEALVDDFRVDRFIANPALWCDDYDVSVAVGAQINFSMNADAGNSGRPYLLLASLSGTSPGFALPGGTMLPLNWDALTDLVFGNLNTVVFQDFYGTLDAAGTASSVFDSFGPLDSGLIGSTAHFAFLLGSPFDYVSNAIPVTFEP